MLPREPKPPLGTPLGQSRNIHVQLDGAVGGGVAGLEEGVGATAGEVVVLPVRGEEGGGLAGGGGGVVVGEAGVVGVEEVGEEGVGGGGGAVVVEGGGDVVGYVAVDVEEEGGVVGGGGKVGEGDAFEGPFLGVWVGGVIGGEELDEEWVGCSGVGIRRVGEPEGTRECYVNFLKPAIANVIDGFGH